MIDYHKDLVTSLKTILPTHYELVLTSGTSVPCISYMEIDNAATANGDRMGVSRLQYQIKVWGNDIAVVQQYAMEVDKVLRPLGWTRVGSNEMYDTQSTMIQKIMTYEATALEMF